MSRQLVLINRHNEIEPDWRLDAQTVEIGRKGIAEARAVLAAARHLEAHPSEPENTPKRQAA